MHARRFALAGVILGLAASCALAAPTEGVPADEALAQMLEGNQRFAQAVSIHPDQDPARRFLLASGQAPLAIVLCCSDSRVPPEVVFDQGLGSLFVVRVAGNVADELGLASIEYAAEHLGARLVMVLGHERCGAVTAAVKGGELPGHLPALMEALQPAVEGSRGAHGDQVEAAIRANVALTSRQLRESGPVLSGLVNHGEMKVVGARYDLDTGVVEVIDPVAAGPRVSAEEALARLVAGNRTFVAGTPSFPDQDAGRRTALAGGQAPFAIILSCSDSRVAPEVVFDQGLGDLFVVRVAGNVANPIGIASLEYAVEHLGARLVVVLGHERCGALTAAVKGGELPGHLPALMDALEPAVAARREVQGDPIEGAIRANIDLNVEALRESAPILSELVEKGELKIIGARYDLDTGVVDWVEAPTHEPATATAAPVAARGAGHGTATAAKAAVHAAPAANHGAAVQGAAVHGAATHATPQAGAHH